MSEPATKIQRTDGEPPAEGGANEPAAARAGTMQSSVSKETPISIPPTITYGLQDTHTTIIPCVFYISMPHVQLNDTRALKIRLNSYENILMNTSLIYGNLPSPHIITYWNKKCDHGFQQPGAATGKSFPVTVLSTSPTPWYSDYYKKLYKYYTVLNTEYEIVAKTSRHLDKGVLLAYSIQTQGTGNDDNALPDNLHFQSCLAQKAMKYKLVPDGRDEDHRASVIYGNYKPGQAKKDVSNDGDVKLWTRTNDAPPESKIPNYQEYLHILPYQDPLSTAIQETQEDASVTGYGVNFQVRLKYTVQYKQLNASARYPTMEATQTAFTTTFPQDFTANYT